MNLKKVFTEEALDAGEATYQDSLDMLEKATGVKHCFLCNRNGNGDKLERHHIFGGANRPKSEKYGLVVDLCGERCHRLGVYSAHQNAQVADYLHRYGQKRYMREQNKTKEQFIAEFGKNYLD